MKSEGLLHINESTSYKNKRCILICRKHKICRGGYAVRNDISDKREREKRIVSEMIQLYCRKQHKTKEGLCPSCAKLKQYAKQRSDHCPFMESKTFCSNCKVHCYKPEMREQIRSVMRFSGPRMIFYHPVMAIRHLIESKREKKRQEKQSRK